MSAGARVVRAGDRRFEHLPNAAHCLVIASLRRWPRNPWEPGPSPCASGSHWPDRGRLGQWGPLWWYPSRWWSTPWSWPVWGLVDWQGGRFGHRGPGHVRTIGGHRHL